MIKSYRGVVRKCGRSLAIVVPKEVATYLELKAGNQVIILEDHGSIKVSANDTKASFDRKMKLASRAMRRYRNALAELAKH